jgi:hypothetical protein
MDWFSFQKEMQFAGQHGLADADDANYSSAHIPAQGDRLSALDLRSHNSSIRSCNAGRPGCRIDSVDNSWF